MAQCPKFYVEYSFPTGRMNARVMETAGKAFYGVWNVRVMETACKRPGTETVGNGNGV